MVFGGALKSLRANAPDPGNKQLDGKHGGYIASYPPAQNLRRAESTGAAPGLAQGAAALLPQTEAGQAVLTPSPGSDLGPAGPGLGGNTDPTSGVQHRAGLRTATLETARSVETFSTTGTCGRAQDATLVIILALKY